MHRSALLESLERYLELHPEDRLRADLIRQFVRNHPGCFQRSHPEGHITASAWIVSPDRRRFLLTHHRKLGRWLQLGGHADGDPDPVRVALREAREESGLSDFELVDTGGTGVPLDVDVHRIPPRPAEPAHLHHDLRYLLIAPTHELPPPGAESHELRWFTIADAEQDLRAPSLLRMARRAHRRLGLG